MSLNLIQQRVERSIYESIRKVLVDEGYWPDETAVDYNVNPNQFKQDIDTIVDNKKFAIEPFGHSSSKNKGDKKIPRISIIPRKYIEGDIGTPQFPVSLQNFTGLGLSDYSLAIPPTKSVHFQLDVILTSEEAKHDIILNAVLNEALPTLGYLPFYDTPNSYFFLHQYNYYDLPDVIDGIEEKVYQYQVNDLYINNPKIIQDGITTIKEITLDTFVPKGSMGPLVEYNSDGHLVINLTGL